MKIKHAYGIAPGVSGSGQETECQDKIKILEANGVSVMSFAGPAERTENSGSQAELADAAAAVMAERFESLYSSEDGFAKNAVLETITKTFQEAGTEPSGTGNSLLFVAVRENRYLAGHMGGGLIAMLNGSCSVLSKPEAEGQGEAEDRGEADLRIYKGELPEPFGFMLMSDGACRSLCVSGTESLSPACTTFFEWLKDYDGETVSEALVDNINKYFLKDTKGDISVAVMVSNEEPVDEPGKNEGSDQEAGKPVRERAKSRNYIKYLIAAALVVILAAVAVLTMNQPGDILQKEQGKAEPRPPVTLSENSEPSVSFSVENPESYDAGTYQVGEDIPAGEYFFWTGEMLKPDSVKVNDFTCLSGELYCLTVRVNEGDTLTSEYQFTAAMNVNPVKAANGILISGKYKIGKDIAPGEYRISPIDKNKAGRYYSVLDGEISNDTEFDEETTIVVPEEGYIVFYNSTLAVKQE